MKKIADISKWQGNVVWAKAAAELEFVILRASCGISMDVKYLRNVEGCVQNGIPFGAYHYVKAGTAEEARREASYFVFCTEKAAKQPSFFIADIEYEAQTQMTTEAVCVAFLDELRKLGCKKIGLYINTRYKWAGAAIGMCDIVWIPHWGLNDGNIPADKYKPSCPHELWQYTSCGSLAGVNGSVDLSLLSGGKPLDFFTGVETIPAPDETEGSEKKMFTNIRLAEFALKVFDAKWVYWYGTYGNKCTQSKYESKAKQYPAHYTASRKNGYMKDIANGCTCADCVGLIKAFFWKNGDLNATPKYGANGCPDKGANSMFALCKESGPISSIPDIPGIVVWKSGHIGVYVGNGYTVEMRGFAYDCVKRKVSEGPWTHWGKLPASMLTYAADGTVSQPESTKKKLGDRLPLSKGAKGDDVKELQNALLALDQTLPKYGADGDFGSETQKAVAAFQAAKGLNQTGALDEATYKALTDALNAPKEPDGNVPDDTGNDPVRSFVLIVSGDEATLRKLFEQYGGTLAEVDSVTVG
jgi:GH25 family lysozyme M1 (1,4-beta-N-acetylmuramidase)|nr:MAG TPA: hypothetical protein [Caudoviricetes sp.]